jgi:hypothetical protein
VVDDEKVSEGQVRTDSTGPRPLGEATSEYRGFAGGLTISVDKPSIGLGIHYPLDTEREFLSQKLGEHANNCNHHLRILTPGKGSGRAGPKGVSGGLPIEK